MINADALKYLVEETGDVLDAVQPFTDADGGKYVATFGSGKVELPPAEPTASTLTVSSLDSFVGYINSNRDALNTERLLILVEPGAVRLVSALQGRHRQRETLIVAFPEGEIFPFGERLPLVDFIVGLQSRFDPSGDRQKLLELVSQVKSSEELEIVDTGAAQELTVNRGLGLKEKARITEPFTLGPFRTFAEVTQPQSPFVLRVYDGPRAALFEADGGAWSITARSNIADYLADTVAEIPILH